MRLEVQLFLTPVSRAKAILPGVLKARQDKEDRGTTEIERKHKKAFGDL